MGIGISVFLLAVGAILAFAVNFNTSGIDVHVVGYILMAAGIVGLAVTLAVFGRRRTNTTYVDDAPVVRDHRDVY